jgi:hypothetical protein
MNQMRIPKAPLFRDPIHDGAADPVIIYNREEKSWWLLYTNRRADAAGQNHAWIHGTDIGVASSWDGGETWLYRGSLPNLEFERGRNTFWAPEILFHEGLYHMYCSYVKGIPTTWDWGRDIVHYTSLNLWDWSFESILKLSSDRVIDACVYRLPGGRWRMLYKDERNHSHSYAAESDDLSNWACVGPAITDCPHEGPNVFFWRGKYWLVTDFWKGLGVYYSANGIQWIRQKDILDIPGSREDDHAYGHHADVLVQDDRAFIFYFTLPEERKESLPGDSPDYNRKRSSLQVAELDIVDNELVCDRDKPFDFCLRDPLDIELL